MNFQESYNPARTPGVDSQVVKDQVIACFERGDFVSAIGILEKSAISSPTSENLALLGLANFQLQKYDLAAKWFTAAVAGDNTNLEWQDMLIKAEANMVAEVHIHVPDIKHFKREELLAPPVVLPGELPQPPAEQVPIWAERVRRDLGTALGFIATLLMEAVTHLWGVLAGYRDHLWTNWYRRSLTL